MSSDAREGFLRVFWVPQIGMNSEFIVSVKDVYEAAKIMDTLADYDMFQYTSGVKPDYSNSGGLQIFRNGGWEDWEDIATGITDPREWAKYEGSNDD